MIGMRVILNVTEVNYHLFVLLVKLEITPRIQVLNFSLIGLVVMFGYQTESGLTISIFVGKLVRILKPWCFRVDATEQKSFQAFHHKRGEGHRSTVIFLGWTRFFFFRNGNKTGWIPRHSMCMWWLLGMIVDDRSRCTIYNENCNQYLCWQTNQINYN